MENQQEHVHTRTHFRPFPTLAWWSLAGNSHFPERSSLFSDILPHPWFIGHKSQKKRETRTAQFRERAVEKGEVRMINRRCGDCAAIKEKAGMTAFLLTLKVKGCKNCGTKLKWLICINMFQLQLVVNYTPHQSLCFQNMDLMETVCDVCQTKTSGTLLLCHNYFSSFDKWVGCLTWKLQTPQETLWLHPSTWPQRLRLPQVTHLSYHQRCSQRRLGPVLRLNGKETQIIVFYIILF